ncbi:MAG: glycosyltransferase [Candidatus Competibacteraceae bacterium]|nr:glycosyltransferase [Candidatus Competibacteraceae bacterium]
MNRHDAKRVLLIGYHYPPIRVSSGIQRMLKFSQYLPDFGWQPAVLSAHPRAYPLVSQDQMGDIPGSITVRRAFALDTSRHLAIRGAYPYWLGLPDRWVSWWLGGLLSGLRLIRRERPAVLWSTYPIATAHLIGLTLHRLTGIPWVADFRDSMTEADYPTDRRQWRVYRWLERATVEACRRAVFTTPGAVRMYAERYSHIEPSRWAVIANGYDEENFTRAEAMVDDLSSRQGAKVLVHSGVLYPWERDPRPFFQALADLKRRRIIDARRLRVVLRASGHDDYHRQHIEALDIQDIVTLAPMMPYEEALKEMLEADGLLLFQAANCNHQIPAKLYEYLRAGRPIMALTDSAGDTAGVLLEAGIDTIVPLDDSQQIATGLEDFLIRLDRGTAPLASRAWVEGHSRYSRTRELAQLLNTVRAETVCRGD